MLSRDDRKIIIKIFIAPDSSDNYRNRWSLVRAQVGPQKETAIIMMRFLCLVMTACYILYTPSFDKFYVGATQEDVYVRLQKHNNKTYDNTYTAYTSDWEIFLFIESANYSQAINIPIINYFKAVALTKV